jgi:hypothetical protein
VSGPRDTIPVAVRVLAAVVVVALLAGWIVLLVLPSHSELFVWPIRPRLSAFMLGSAYAAGSYYWLRVLVGRAWHAIAAGLLPVALFAATLGLATAVHWGKFDHHGALIVIWVVLYATVPLILPVLWVGGRTRDSGAPAPGDAVVPSAVRVVLAAAGAAQFALGLALFVRPGSVAGVWPWPLSELTARVTAGWFAWGLVWLMLVRDSRWSSARVAVDATLLGLAVALAGLGRGWSELDRGRVSTWLLVAGLAVGLLALAALRLAMRRRPVRLPETQVTDAA